MTLNYDESRLVSRLKNVSFARAVIFATCCATRLLPAYESFAEVVAAAKPELLRETINFLWNELLNAEKPLANVQTYLDALIDNIPDDDDMQLDTAYAEDAISSVAYVLRLLVTRDVQEAAYAARRSYEAAFEFSERDLNLDSSSHNSVQKINQHAVVQAELQRQERDLCLLEQTDAEDTHVVMQQLKSQVVSESTIPS